VKPEQKCTDDEFSRFQAGMLATATNKDVCAIDEQQQSDNANYATKRKPRGHLLSRIIVAVQQQCC
jgi:hypothetical protein